MGDGGEGAGARPAAAADAAIGDHEKVAGMVHGARAADRPRAYAAQASAAEIIVMDFEPQTRVQASQPMQ